MNIIFLYKIFVFEVQLRAKNILREHEIDILLAESRRVLACVDASLEFVRTEGKTDFTASKVSFVKCPNDPISMHGIIKNRPFSRTNILKQTDVLRFSLFPKPSLFYSLLGPSVLVS